MREHSAVPKDCRAYSWHPCQNTSYDKINLAGDTKKPDNYSEKDTFLKNTLETLCCAFLKFIKLSEVSTDAIVYEVEQIHPLTSAESSTWARVIRVNWKTNPPSNDIHFVNEVFDPDGNRISRYPALNPWKDNDITSVKASENRHEQEDRCLPKDVCPDKGASNQEKIIRVGDDASDPHVSE